LYSLELKGKKIYNLLYSLELKGKEIYNLLYSLELMSGDLQLIVQSRTYGCTISCKSPYP
jgi:hypothetical protein